MSALHSARESDSYNCVIMQVVESKEEERRKRKFMVILLSVGQTLPQLLKSGSPSIRCPVGSAWYGS